MVMELEQHVIADGLKLGSAIGERDPYETEAIDKGVLLRAPQQTA